MANLAACHVDYHSAVLKSGPVDNYNAVLYYSIGTNLERTWGTFYYNVYLFMGMIFTILGSFLIMGISYVPLFGLSQTMDFYGTTQYFIYVARNFSTYFVNMSIFLGFAATFPEVQVLLMFIIPIKVKWMGIAYAILLGVQFFP